MAYAKQWKLTVTQLESLIDAVDSNGYCYVEAYSDTSDKIVDSELWLKLSTGWADEIPILPPAIPLPPV